MRVVDLFAGLGGFSAGALAAGASVELGVDNDHVPLKLFAANVPNAKVKLATLGPDGGEDVKYPPAATDLHMHASSPCTELSPAKASATEADIASGLATLRWALELVLGRGDYSWSVENVSTIKTRALLQEYVDRHPERVAFASLDAAEFGAAQSRVRLIGGPPKLIRALKEMPSARRVSVREAYEKRGLVVPAPAFKNQTRNRDGTPCTRSVEEQSFTICASHGLTWCDRDGTTVKVMTANDSSLLMGFPKEWRLPKGSRDAQRAVGNALCVAMSRAIMDAAIAVQADNKATLQVPPPLEPPTAEPLPAPTMDEMNRRLGRIEKLLLSLAPSVESPPHGDAELGSKLLAVLAENGCDQVTLSSDHGGKGGESS